MGWGGRGDKSERSLPVVRVGAQSTAEYIPTHKNIRTVERVPKKLFL
jgi:hypothetical protein